jgi:hypothetical protein
MFEGFIEKEDVWARHSNPKSGWSRMAAGFVIVAAFYHRKWKVVGLTVLFLILNPVLFREPTEESDDWMYKVVQAEERWTDDGNCLIGLDYPQIFNTASIPVGLYGLYAAYKRKPISTVVFTIASQGLNQWCMKEIIEYYEEVDSQ